MSALQNATFIIPGVWRPARSLLGRWIEAHSVDERQAESTFFVVVVVVAIGLVLMHILAWTLFRQAWGGDALWTFGDALWTFIAGEAFVCAAVAAAAFVGWAPAIIVRAAGAGLIITRGRAVGSGYAETGASSRPPRIGEAGAVLRTRELDGVDDRGLWIPYDAIDTMARVSARTFHQHYRRYAETRVFVNRMEDELILLQWNGVPIVIGLPPADLTALERILTAHTSVESSHVGAA